MSRTLVFQIANVLPLLDHAEANKPAFLYEDCVNKDLFKEGVKIKRGGYAEFEQLDESKLPKRLALVKDQGVYLMSNANERLMKAGTGETQIAYAKRCNPEVDKDWYDTAVAIMGGDDTAIGLPTEWFRRGITSQPEATEFHIKVTATRVALTLK